jgi:hypothetical protein
MVKNVLGVHALLTLRLLRAPDGGRHHDKHMVDAMPSPLPAGSRWLQELGCLVLTRPQVAILRPAKTSCGQARPQRRLRIEPGKRRVARCRIVQDRLRLWKQGVRDLVMELCCVLHTFRVRLTPWQPMV